MYAELVKTFGICLTYGVVNPIIGIVGAVGILARALSLSYLVQEWNEKVKRGEAQPLPSTDAQGMPFRCITLVVTMCIGFFGSACVVGMGVDLLSDDGSGGAKMLVIVLGAAFGALGVQILILGCTGAWCEQRRGRRGGEADSLVGRDDLGLLTPLRSKI